ncbi:MAG: transporter [Proteobacteria bacterium]|nr:transporter [Pseudomonadota bacterium]MBU1449582.1 transporter [Pseudomonadota bacterium]MBU2516879.1 transporter [Pseudomonadota bacterium]
MGKLKQMLISGVLLACVVVLGALPAGAMGHYPPGGEGVRAATVPPPGFHYRTYGVFVNSDKLMDNNGDEMKIGFDLNKFVWVNRFVYITDVKILGADFGVHVLIPTANTNIEIAAAGIDESHCGLGDIVVEPFVLGWHGARYDGSFALAVVLPTGDYDTDNPASPGLGYWTGLLTFGGTYYFDDARTWSASLLNRLTWNSVQEDTNITPGVEWVAEWGVGKDLKASDSLIITPGVRGHVYMQLSEDDGANATDNLSRAFGIGPEINFFWLTHLLQINFAFVQDFGVENEAECQQFVVTVTKSF